MNFPSPPFKSNPEGRNKDALPRVLIVDDNTDVRLMLKRLLGVWGAEVLEAENGRKAIEIACAELPDLILMDFNMPIMGGVEATRQLKQIPETKAIPIVAVSADCVHPDQVSKALKDGFDYCLGKPVDLKKLRTMLDVI